MTDERDDSQKRMERAAEAFLSIPEVKAWMLSHTPRREEGDDLWATNADETGAVVGYMCLIEWQFELGSAARGNRVYPSLDALKAEHTCWEECGVVEVEVRARRIVVPGKVYGEESQE